MKRSIYSKFIFIYIVAAILSFLFVAEGTSRMIMNHMTTKKADTLYKEAVLLSTDYAEDYYRSRTASSLETVYSHLDVIATYLNAEIWMIDMDGKVILESDKKLIDPDYKIPRSHGQWVCSNGVWMTAIYHPSALLRDLSKRPETFEDLLYIRDKYREVHAEIGN